MQILTGDNMGVAEIWYGFLYLLSAFLSLSTLSSKFKLCLMDFDVKFSMNYDADVPLTEWDIGIDAYRNGKSCNLSLAIDYTKLSLNVKL